jgi:hypothetical protein
MLGRLRRAWKLIGKLRRLGRMEADLETIKLQNGRIWSRMMQVSPPETLDACAFKVFSQWGEDGIGGFLGGQLSLPDDERRLVGPGA